MSEELEKKDDTIKNEEVNEKKHPTGKLALLIGLIAAILCLVPIISILVGIIGTILGKRAKEYNEDKTLGNLAIISSVFAIIINTIITITSGFAIYYSINLIDKVNNSNSDDNSREEVLRFFERLDITLDKITL